MLRLYCGLVRDNVWYNHTKVNSLKGGVLAMLDTGEKIGAARLLNLLKGSIDAFYTEDGQEYKLTEKDYLEIELTDAWRIGYEQIKKVTGEEQPVIDEYFFCSRCSRQGDERYTFVQESWQKLIDDGYMAEIFLDEPADTFEIELPESVSIEGSKTILGGSFNTIIFKRLTVSDMLKIQRSADAMATEANYIYATWDTMLVHVNGITDKDLNLLKRKPNSFFSKEYFISKANIDAIVEAENENMVGIDPSTRSVMCQNCGNEIGGGLDQSNFFSPLLPKKPNRSM